ncbi:hypothetical protein P8605_23180 [Streptomyces sp. T-3]|nr:hypothetical protein [Streptomyces sp. T-3]
MTDLERTAAQAYLRLLQCTRAALADTTHPEAALPLLAVPLAEADRALQASGFAGNESALFRMVGELCVPADVGVRN